MSTLITTAPHFHWTLYAPVSCLDAADRIRPGLARHVGRLPGVEPIDLTYSGVLDLRERSPEAPLEVAQVISLARPGLEWATGLTVATAEPEWYTAYGVSTYSIGD